MLVEGQLGGLDHCLVVVRVSQGVASCSGQCIEGILSYVFVVANLDELELQEPAHILVILVQIVLQKFLDAREDVLSVVEHFVYKQPAELFLSQFINAEPVQDSPVDDDPGLLIELWPMQ